MKFHKLTACGDTAKTLCLYSQCLRLDAVRLKGERRGVVTGSIDQLEGPSATAGREKSAGYRCLKGMMSEDSGNDEDVLLNGAMCF